jgi:hypothetical protein
VTLPEGTPLVVLGDDWGRHVSSLQHVFGPIIPRYPVVWVNSIGHRVPRLSWNDARRAWQKLRKSAPDAGLAVTGGPAPRVIIEPRVIPWHHRRSVLAFNTWSLVRAIRAALRRVDCRERPLLVTGSPPSVGVVGRLGESASVYFCMDDFLVLPGVSPEMIAPLEERLLARVDAVVATAQKLVRTKRPLSGRSFYLPQGVNLRHFAGRRAEPAEVRLLPHPRIGFAGGVSDCVDVSLVRRLGEAFPEGSIILVGPISIDVSQLRLPNVHLLGPRPYRDLPAYVQSFDIGIIPYLLNQWTEAVDPLKLLEYLAAGLPVVTTALPEVQKYANVVAVAADADSFIRKVREGLREDRDEVRRRAWATAARNTWDERASTMLDFLGSLVREPRGVLATAGAG